MISYTLAKQLKDAGFPQKPILFSNAHQFLVPDGYGDNSETNPIKNLLNIPETEKVAVYVPTLSELIEACNMFEYPSSIGLGSLRRDIGCNGHCEEYTAIESGFGNKLKFGHGSTPEEAVARLWLELNKK